MKRLYYAFLPLNYKREGNVWWFKDLPAPKLQPSIELLKPVCSALRVSSTFPNHSWRSITPPADATTIK